MKEITTDQKVDNAIKWLNALRPEAGFKKTIGKLCEYIPYTDEKEYCCLGVGCTALQYNEITFVDNIISPQLKVDVGLNNSEGRFEKNNKPVSITINGRTIMSLASLNDEAYKSDKNFKNIHKFIMDNLDIVFIPEVAKGLKRHYSR